MGQMKCQTGQFVSMDRNEGRGNADSFSKRGCCLTGPVHLGHRLLDAWEVQSLAAHWSDHARGSLPGHSERRSGVARVVFLDDFIVSS